jgi:hypothetical protein
VVLFDSKDGQFEQKLLYLNLLLYFVFVPKLPKNMKIQSSFKDYYDGSASLGVDVDVVFRRETSTIQVENGCFLADLPQHFPDNLGEIDEFDYSDAAIILQNKKTFVQFLVIGFCGNLHVAAVNSKPENTPQHEIAYFGAAIAALDWSNKPRNRRPSERQIILEMLRLFHQKQDIDVFKKLKAPIFLTEIRAPLTRYETKNLGLYAQKFELNPCLKNIQFFKEKDPFSTFQEIQGFISGVLGQKNEDSMIEISNNSKILKAGFDLKTSFRK